MKRYYQPEIETASAEEIRKIQLERLQAQVKRVYDSCLQQEQLDDKEIVITSYAMVANANNCCSCGCGCTGCPMRDKCHPTNDEAKSGEKG